MIRTTATAALAALAVGCGGVPAEVSEDQFAEVGARVLCDRVAECMRGAFDGQYFGMSDCRAHYEQQLQAVVDALAETDCTYDPGAASDGWTTAADMSCEKFYEDGTEEALADVWGDCGGYLPPETTYSAY